MPLDLPNFGQQLLAATGLLTNVSYIALRRAAERVRRCIPGADTTPEGADPDRDRGPGHSAPTY